MFIVRPNFVIIILRKEINLILPVIKGSQTNKSIHLSIITVDHNTQIIKATTYIINLFIKKTY